jgi:hypothetical protein
MNSAQYKLRAQLGAASRHSPENAPAIAVALKVSRAVDFIDGLLEDPKPSMQERGLLALLLIGDEHEIAS